MRTIDVLFIAVACGAINVMAGVPTALNILRRQIAAAP